MTPESCIDPRHVYLIHDILCRGQFRSALEIGSFDGASSTAFVESLKHTQGSVTLCDIVPSRSVMRVASRAPLHRVSITGEASTNVLAWPDEFDFVLVDGFHAMEDVQPEIELLLKRRPRCIMAHDTSATRNGELMAEGAQYLKSVFMEHCAYQWIEDAEFREGEATERGLFFATTDSALFEQAQEAFRKWTS